MGDSTNISDSKENIIILDFWYNGCAPCQMAFPLLNKLFNEYKNKGVRVIAINPIDDRIKDSISIAKTITRNLIDFDIAFVRFDIVKYLGIISYPTMYILDKNKKILYVKTGFNKETYIDSIKKILDENLE